MNTFKRHIALAMVLIMVITLIGCTEKPTNSQEGKNSSLTESVISASDANSDKTDLNSLVSDNADNKSSKVEGPKNNQDKFTVTFKSNKSTVYKTVSVKKGETVDWFEEPTKSGYIFECWKKADNTEFSLFEPINNNLTLIASWSKTYNVYYLNEDGTEFYAEPVREGQAALFIGYPSPYIKGNGYFEFEKWVTSKGGSTSANLKNITKDVKVYAKFKKTQLPTLADAVDFVVNIPSGRDVRILQLTDTQITNSKTEQKCFKYIEGAVKASNPDLILLTGDIVYGRFDSTGSLFKEIVNYMDSLGIPWAPVFGNHDNESTKGVTWQCKELENAKNCLFKRGNLTGNGNYSIGIMQGGKMVKAIYMLDSNGCAKAYTGEIDKVKTSTGFGSDQLDWLNKSSILIDVTAGYSVSKFIGFHIPIAEFAYGAYASGYQNSDAVSNAQTYTIGKDVTAKNNDFGCKGELFKSAFSANGLWKTLKDNNFDGVFVGHSHKNNVSILYDGIRLTFGLKSSTYDRYTSGQLGGTLITVAEGGKSFKAQHIYVD